MKMKFVKLAVIVGWSVISLGGGYAIATEVFEFQHPASQVFATLGGSFVIGCILTSISKAFRK